MPLVNALVLGNVWKTVRDRTKFVLFTDRKPHAFDWYYVFISDHE